MLPFSPSEDRRTGLKLLVFGLMVSMCRRNKQERLYRFAVTHDVAVRKGGVTNVQPQAIA